MELKTHDKGTKPKTLAEKYNIRRDISDEDLVEIMELFDQVISVTIRDMLKKTFVEKLTELIENGK